MPETTKETDVPEQSGRKLSVVDARRATEKGAKAERERVSQIRDAFGPFLNREGAHSLLDEAIDDGWSVEETMRALLDFAADAPVVPEGAEPIQGAVRRREGTKPAKADHYDQKPNHAARVEAGEDAREKFRKAAEQNILVRGGAAARDNDKDMMDEFRRSEFRSFTFADLARKECELRGIDVTGKDRGHIITMALQRAGSGVGSSDLASVTENIANKQMIAGYELDPGVWRSIARIGSLNDFRATSRVNLGAMGDFKERAEDGEYQAGYVSDYGEKLTAKGYGRIFNFTRELLLNDDVGALVRAPFEIGRKGSMIVAKKFIETVVANPVLAADGVAVYAAAHNNIGTSGNAGAPSVVSLSHGRQLMRSQKTQESKAGEDDGDYINASAAFLLVPVALETVAEQLIGSEFDPSTSNDTRTRNPFYNGPQVLSDPRLDDDSTQQWYLFANPSTVPTIEVAFVNGQSVPVVESMDDFKTDGIAIKGRVEFDVAFLDFRGTYRNAGGT